MVPRHCFAPGLQSPVQAPAPLQMYWQAVPGSQVPIGLQVCGVLLAPQRLVPGMHSPPQLPLEQTFGRRRRSPRRRSRRRSGW